MLCNLKLEPASVAAFKGTRQEEENVSSLLATRVINQCPKGYSTNYNSSSCIDVKLSCKNNTLEKKAAQIVARRHVEMPLQEKKFLQKKNSSLHKSPLT